VLEPGHEVTHDRDQDVCTWEIDTNTHSARLVDPPSSLSELALPLAPMLGCFGVAPSGGQSISTATSGPYGGNMDYRGFVAGVTVYLPVEEPGALFFLGDGHALQGDGEIVGTGVEVSMDVRFRVDLQKGKRISWPRAENDAYLMTIGNARPLDQSVQHATTEMLRWLEDDLGISPLAAHSLLGQCVEYDLANMFDPAYTMVCRIRKDLLRRCPSTAAASIP
jgi:acetamidase/formamidase